MQWLLAGDKEEDVTVLSRRYQGLDCKWISARTPQTHVNTRCDEALYQRSPVAKNLTPIACVKTVLAIRTRSILEDKLNQSRSPYRNNITLQLLRL